METSKFDRAAFEAAKNRRLGNKPATPQFTLSPMEGEGSKGFKEAAGKRSLIKN